MIHKHLELPSEQKIHLSWKNFFYYNYFLCFCLLDGYWIFLWFRQPHMINQTSMLFHGISIFFLVHFY